MKTTPCTENSNIKRGYAYFKSPRCHAKTRNGTMCKSPAVKGNNRCRMHGGARGSGAPNGNQNAIKHGHTTREAKKERQRISNFIKDCRKLITQTA